MREANQKKKGGTKELSKSSLQICMYVACMQHVSASITFLGEFSHHLEEEKKTEKTNLSVNSTKFAKILKYFSKF